MVDSRHATFRLPVCDHLIALLTTNQLAVIFPQSKKTKKCLKLKIRQVFFLWTDNKVELLLRVTLDYKNKSAMENIDWESKYRDILAGFLTEYPKVNGSPEERDFPHKAEEVIKAGIITKLKAIRRKYRKAVDSGRKSGHGSSFLSLPEHMGRISGNNNNSYWYGDLVDVDPDDDKLKLWLLLQRKPRVFKCIHLSDSFWKA